MADPGRGFDAIVVGEYERAFTGHQLTDLLPLLPRHHRPDASGVAVAARPAVTSGDSALPATAPHVRWIFAQRIEGHSAAGIARIALCRRRARLAAQAQRPGLAAR
jgi:hypothetical protein